jgi:hypothetical protein
VKSFSASQIPLIERPHATPLYFCHIYMPGETLYFSDRNFKLNSHDYEAYLLGVPDMVGSIERFGGYLNISARIMFRNLRFRSYNRLFDYFVANPLTRREMDLYVLYVDHEIPGVDTPTLLHRVAFGAPGKITIQTFDFELFSILHTIDQRKFFTKISRKNWPDAAANAVGKFENRWIGKMRNVACHCVEGGAVSTLAQNLAGSGTTIYLSDVENPKAFPTSGAVQIGFEAVTYTGRSLATNALLGCTRGQIAKDYKAGEAVAEKRATYKFLASTRPMKSISAVYAGGNLVAPADYTVTLNDSGKATIRFNAKNLITSWGAHSHGFTSSEPFHPTGGTFTASSQMGAQGIGAYLYDQDEGTFCSVGVTGVTDGPKDAYFTVTFPAYTGAAPDAVYACWKGGFSLGTLAGEYFRITAPETKEINGNRIKLTGATPPTTLTFRAHTNQGTTLLPCYLFVQNFEMWLELEYNMASRGDPKVWDLIAAAITCDGEGDADDSSGTYTGTPNALIENPSDVIRYLLVGVMGRSMSEIGASFTAVRNILAGQTLNGYKIGANLVALGATPEEVIGNICKQSGLELREDGGKFELRFLPPPYTINWSADMFAGGTASASSSYQTNVPSRAVDDNETTYWMPNSLEGGAWWKYDFGAGVANAVNRLRMKTRRTAGTNKRVRDFILSGSIDNTNWTKLLETYHSDNDNWEEWNFLNTTGYRYVRIDIVSLWPYTPYGNLFARIDELEIMGATKTPGSAPSSAMTIDQTIYLDSPVFGSTPAAEIKNLIRVRYNKDWSGLGGIAKYGDFINEMERPDPPSSDSITKYGELSEDVDLQAVYLPDMAEDLTNWRLLQKQDVVPTVELSCNRKVARLEKGDYFVLNDCGVAAWEGALWRILEIGEARDKQRFALRAIMYIGP